MRSKASYPEMDRLRFDPTARCRRPTIMQERTTWPVSAADQPRPRGASTRIAMACSGKRRIRRRISAMDFRIPQHFRSHCLASAGAHRTNGNPLVDPSRQVLTLPGSTVTDDTACSNPSGGYWSNLRGAKWINGHYADANYNHHLLPNDPLPGLQQCVPQSRANRRPQSTPRRSERTLRRWLRSFRDEHNFAIDLGSDGHCLAGRRSSRRLLKRYRNEALNLR